MRYRGVLIDSISIIQTPYIYLILSLHLIKDAALWFKSLVLRRGIIMGLIILLWITIIKVDTLQTIEDMSYFSLYWIILGVASSIGLGTGLHTFVLYLGPHIAKVTMAATQCGFIPEMIPSKWTFDHFQDCTLSTNSVDIMDILFAVQLQSFLWGLGTVLGQLPPYFVARKAVDMKAQLKRISDEAEHHALKLDEEEEKLIQKEKKVHPLSTEEIEEVLQLKRKDNLSLMEKAKVIIYDNMEKYGFWTVLFCASIPNPLFDLAGIACGHLRIPFKIFFSACFIGKALIKSHMQMLFVIAIFRKQTMSAIIETTRKISAFLAESAQSLLEEQKKLLYEPTKFTQSSSVLSKVWNLFIIGMIGYFIKSIIDAEVKEKAIELRDKQERQ